MIDFKLLAEAIWKVLFGTVKNLLLCTIFFIIITFPAFVVGFFNGPMWLAWVACIITLVFIMSVTMTYQNLKQG